MNKVWSLQAKNLLKEGNLAHIASLLLGLVQNKSIVYSPGHISNPGGWGNAWRQEF
jgi:hypothetical protein